MKSFYNRKSQSVKILKWAGLLGIITSAYPIMAQTRVVTTAVPTLRIAPDARAAGMGDIGVATTPDASTTYWNTAKLAFVEHKSAVQFSAIPWLHALVNDIWIYYLSGYYRVDDQQTLGGAVRYFDLGSLTCTDYNGEPIGESNPHEYAVDVSYGRKFSPNFSLGLGLRFIYSNLTTGGCRAALGNTFELKPAGTSVAGDIGFYYRKPFDYKGNDAHWAIGVNISNIGSKIAYTETTIRDFIPTNFGLGGAVYLPIDNHNELTIAAEINKLMVPTPDPLGQYRQKSVVEGMLTSFFDAPGGFKEELQETNFAIGLEYWYLKQFAVRTGYFYEHPQKGNRQYATLGVGLRFKMFSLDISYLLPTTRQPSPLQNTFRFTFHFTIDKGDSEVEPRE